MWLELSRSHSDFYLLFTKTWSFIKENSNFSSTRIVASFERHFTIDFEKALKFDAWRAATFTFPYKTRIAQFPVEARIISVSNKIQRQTLAGNARFLLTPEGLTLRRFVSSSRFRFCSRSNSRSLLFITSPPPFPSTLPLASRSALFSGRNIARNNVKYLLSGRLFPSARRDKHHYVMYIKPRGRR